MNNLEQTKEYKALVKKYEKPNIVRFYTTIRSFLKKNKRYPNEKEYLEELKLFEIINHHTFDDIYKILCDKMDKRDAYYRELDSFYVTHGFMPTDHAEAYAVHLKDPRPWRKIPGAKRKIRLAARKMLKNENTAKN